MTPAYAPLSEAINETIYHTAYIRPFFLIVNRHVTYSFHVCEIQLQAIAIVTKLVYLISLCVMQPIIISLWWTGLHHIKCIVRSRSLDILVDCDVSS